VPLETNALLELADGWRSRERTPRLRSPSGTYRFRDADTHFLWLTPFRRHGRWGEQTISRCTSNGTAGWVELIGHVKSLNEAGVLVEPNGIKASRRAHDKRFDSAPIHIRMLNDERRTSSFQAAIRRTVRPGDVSLRSEPGPAYSRSPRRCRAHGTSGSDVLGRLRGQRRLAGEGLGQARSTRVALTCRPRSSDDPVP
jgi:hypothetical protein